MTNQEQVLHASKVKELIGSTAIEVLARIFENSTGQPPSLPAKRFRADHAEWIPILNQLEQALGLLEHVQHSDSSTYRIKCYALPLINSSKATELLGNMEKIFIILKKHYKQSLEEVLTIESILSSLKIDQDKVKMALKYMCDVSWYTSIGANFPYKENSAIRVGEQVLIMDHFSEFISNYYEQNLINNSRIRRNPVPPVGFDQYEYGNREQLLLEVGERLRSARVRKKIGRKAVSNRTKLRPTVIEALELGDWSQMPGDVFGIGLLRQYGNYLGLNVDKEIEYLKSARFSEKGTKKRRSKNRNTDNEKTTFKPYEGGTVTAALDEATSEDHLGRTALVDALRGLLDHPDQKGKLTIGLMGHWGAGKSSVIEMLKATLGDEHRTQHEFICAEFDAWAYEHCGNIQAGIAQEVVNGLTKGLKRSEKLRLAWRLANKQHSWELWSTLGSFLWLIGSVTGLFLVGQHWLVGFFGVSAVGSIAVGWSQIKKVVASPLAAQLQTYLRLPDFGEHLGTLPIMRKQIAELCKERLGTAEDSKRLLFVIDNLDRCGVEGVVKVFEATHIVMELPQVVVIIAVDHRMALAALTQHYSELAEKGSNRTAQAIARDYLGKIFQLSIQLDSSSDRIGEYIERKLFHDVVEDVEPVKERKGVTSKEDQNDAQNLIEHPNPKDKNEISVQDTALLDDDINKSTQVENRAMKDTSAEKRRFEELANLLSLHNPRQLKRLHNTYRLLKGINWHRNGRPPIDEKMQAGWLAEMAMLFWLEYLYDQNTEAKEKHETGIKNLKDNSISLHRTLRSLLMVGGRQFDDKLYDDLKTRVQPLTLPFAERKEV